MSEDQLVVRIAALEAAINRCNASQGRGSVQIQGVAVEGVRYQVVLCRDSSLMAEVYGVMIYTRSDTWPLDRLTSNQRAAYLRWHATS
jgi:hypothetical protein